MGNKVLGFNDKEIEELVNDNPILFLQKPFDNSIFLNLGIYYFKKGIYDASFSYLYSYYFYNSDEGVIEYRWDNEEAFDIYLFIQLGLYFKSLVLNNDHVFDNSGKMFLSFERAYVMYKGRRYNGWYQRYIDKNYVEDIYYNLAYCYLEGIGTKRNIDKGLKLLKVLDRKTHKSNKTIYDINDSEKIIKKFYS